MFDLVHRSMRYLLSTSEASDMLIEVSDNNNNIMPNNILYGRL